MPRISNCLSKFLPLSGAISIALTTTWTFAFQDFAEESVEKVTTESSSSEKSADKSEAKTEKEDNSNEDAKEDNSESKSNESAKEGKASESTAEQSKSDEEPSKDEADKKPEVEKKSKPFVVKRKPLKIEQKLDGIFVATEMHEVAVRPDTWSRFVVLEAVEHGKEVKKGELLVRFDDEQIDDRLADESIDLRLSELSLMLAEEETPREEKLLELAYREAKRDYDQLVEDHQYYLSTDRPFAERIAKYRYDSAKEDLESQREELAQLKKMYEADELTEETEAIVLRRQEFEVNTAELMLELQTASRDYTLNVSLPRNDLSYTTALEGAKLALERAKTARELGISQGKYELEKKREARAKSVRTNADLLGDRALMELRAPIDGTVYYGRCVNGKWGEINTLSSKLVPYGTIPPNTVVMTIVNQRPLFVTTDLSEKEFTEFKVGFTATITPSADDDVEIEAKVRNLAGIPNASRKFEMQFDLENSELPDWLVAGMSCTAKVLTYEKKDALQIPKDLVQTDDEDEKTKYVLLFVEDEEEPQRREVKLGHSKDDIVEILEGLEEGDKISKDKPKKEEKGKEE